MSFVCLTDCPLCKEGKNWHREAEEGGITDNSIHNAHYLINRYGFPISVELFIDYAEGHSVKFTWDDAVAKRSFIFTGFGWGYAGRGSVGLMDLLNKILKVEVPVSFEEVSRLMIPEGSSQFYFQGKDY